MRGADSIMTSDPAAGALKGFLAAGSPEALYGFGRLPLSAAMQASSENGMANGRKFKSFIQAIASLRLASAPNAIAANLGGEAC